MSRTRRKLREDWRERLKNVSGARRRQLDRSAPGWTREEIDEVMRHEMLRDEMMREVAERVRRELDFDPSWD